MLILVADEKDDNKDVVDFNFSDRDRKQAPNSQTLCPTTQIFSRCVQCRELKLFCLASASKLFHVHETNGIISSLKLHSFAHNAIVRA